MNRQPDIILRREPCGSSVAVTWKLCDNGYTLEGQASYEIKTGHIRWVVDEPPIEDESLLRELIIKRVRDYLAGDKRV